MAPKPRNKKQKTGSGHAGTANGESPEKTAKSTKKPNQSPADAQKRTKSTVNTKNFRKGEMVARSDRITAMTILVVVADGNSHPTYLMGAKDATKVLKKEAELKAMVEQATIAANRTFKKLNKPSAKKTNKPRNGRTVKTVVKAKKDEDMFLTGFMETHKEPSRNYDILEVLLGPMHPTVPVTTDETKASNISFADKRLTDRINFKAEGAGRHLQNRVDEWATKGKPLLPLFDYAAGMTADTLGTNAILADFLLELLKNPHLGVDGEERKLKNGTKVAKDKTKAMTPSVVYTKQSTMSFLMLHFPEQMTGVLGVMFDMVLMGNHRNLKASEKVTMLKELHWGFGACERKLIFPPASLQMLVVQREKFEKRFVDTEYLLKKVAVPPSTFPTGDYWLESLWSVMEEFDQEYGRGDPLYNRETILSNGLVCKVSSKDDVEQRERVVFVDAVMKIPKKKAPYTKEDYKVLLTNSEEAEVIKIDDFIPPADKRQPRSNPTLETCTSHRGAFLSNCQKRG